MGTTEPTPTAPPPATPAGHPTAIWFFFWGEFAERCSYYGMRAILTLYLTTKLGMPDDRANEWYGLFKMACYFLPLLGGFIADRFLGKYWTIVGFSVPYVLGQLLIGGGVDTESAVLLALALCAMGSGVIKPNISALLGMTYDQQRPGDMPLRARAFMWFYFSVNVGALLSMFGLPIIRNKFGYQVAFLVPAGFMAVALFIFAIGKKFYGVERSGPAPAKTPEQKAEQWKTLGRLFGVFALMVFFWMVYEHNDVQWVFFAREHVDLRLPDGAPDWLGAEKDGVPTRMVAPDQFQFINSLAVLVLIVFFNFFWKTVDPTGKRFPHTTKILLGFLFTGAAPALLALAAQGTAGGAKVSMLWMVGAYAILTVGEVLVYGTMLDLSYAYAPASMKGFITACFLVTNTFGNFINIIYGKFYYSGLGKGEVLTESLNWGARVTTEKGDTVFRFYPEVFFTADALVAVAAAVVFFFVARQFNKSVAA